MESNLDVPPSPCARRRLSWRDVRVSWVKQHRPSLFNNRLDSLTLKKTEKPKSRKRVKYLDETTQYRSNSARAGKPATACRHHTLPRPPQARKKPRQRKKSSSVTPLPPKIPLTSQIQRKTSCPTRKIIW